MDPKDRQTEGNAERPGKGLEVDVDLRRRLQARRKLLIAFAALPGAAMWGRSLADSLADVPPRGPGDLLGGHSDRSKYVHIERIPEAGPGMRNVDPINAFNSKAPLDKLVGIITPSDLHYE